MPDLAAAYGLSLAVIALLVYLGRRNRGRGWRPKPRPTLPELLGSGDLWRLAVHLEEAPGQPIEAQLQRLAENLGESKTPQPVADPASSRASLGAAT